MSAKLQIEKYFEALQRLVERGAKINNDTVALEAGSGRGSIKKSRAAYADLIAAIEQTAQKQVEAKIEADPLPAIRQENSDLVRQLDSALERELALLTEVYSLREQLRQLHEQLASKPVLIHNRRPPSQH
jgi:polyhydroxyalkanoate synthesis regulator phasin